MSSVHRAQSAAASGDASMAGADTDGSADGPPAGTGAEQEQRNISVVVLTILIGAVAGILFWAYVVDLPSDPVAMDLPWPVFVALFFFAELFYVTLRTRRSGHGISLSEMPLVLGAATLAPATVVLARLGGSAVGLMFSHRGRGLKLLFNLALHAFDACLFVLLFFLLLDGASPLEPRGWLAALVAVVVTDAVTAVLVTLVIVTHDDDRAEWRRLPRDLVRGSTVAITNACVALVALLAMRENPAAGVLLLVVAVIASFAYRRYITRSESSTRVERLYDFTSRLGGTVDVQDIVPLTMRQVRDELRAAVAELIVPRSDGSSQHSGNSGTSPVPDPRHPSGSSHRTAAAVSGGERWHLDDRGMTRRPLEESDAWWQAALTGVPVLLPAGRRTAAPAGADGPRDGMAVPVVLDDGRIAVLAVSESLPDQSFGRDELRLFQAMANHAAVAFGKARLVDRLRRQASEQEHIALHDALTALPNRRNFTSLLGTVLEGSDDDVAVLLLDLNGFKDVNDTLGHDIGDQLLQEVGARLTSWLHGRGLVARLGGDEFAVLLTGLSDSEDLCAIAEEVRRCVAVPYRLDQLTLEVSAGVGVALAGQGAREARTLLQQADVAMYAAKNRDAGVAMYQAENDHNSRRRLTLLSSLRSAIDNGDLYVHYQPQVSTADGAVRGVEALVRWHHAELGEVTPDEFIALAEHSGVVRPLTLWVLESALTQVAEWRAGGHELSVAVNLSTRNLLDARLPSDIARLLKQTGVSPAALTLEITESSIMADRAAEVLERIADLGVELSVDDFGTGYSSLGYLQQLPVNEVKIDQSFVQALLTQRGDRSIVRAIVHLGHELGLRVVAEGVEEVETLRFLQRLGCDLVQGYVFAQPMCGADLENWLAQRHEGRRLVSVS